VERGAEMPKVEKGSSRRYSLPRARPRAPRRVVVAFPVRGHELLATLPYPSPHTAASFRGSGWSPRNKEERGRGMECQLGPLVPKGFIQRATTHWSLVPD
jgi:hypothetical protein